MSRQQDRGRQVLPMVLMLLLALAATSLRLRQTANTVDDAFITYRYAANLAAGNGLVYNAGEQVLGTSSPVYALLLVPAVALAGVHNLPTASLIFNALMDGLLTMVLFLGVARLAGGGTRGLLAGFAAGLLYAVDAKSVDFSSGGMEAPLFTGCLLSCAWLLSRSRYTAAALLAAASVAVRPDGGLVLVVVLLVAWLHGRRLPWRGLMGAAGILLALGTLAWAAYGDPIPASVRAKASGIYMLPADHALRYLCRHLAGMAWPRLPLGRLLPFLSGAAREYATLLASSILPVALMVSGWRLGRRHLGAAADFLAGYSVLFFLIFAAANPFMMGWYYVPLETAYIALLALGALTVGTSMSRHLLVLFLAPAGRVAVGVGLTLALLLLPQLQRYQWLPLPGQGAVRLLSEWEKIRESDYLRVGADLARLTGGRARVAAPEIGGLGFAYPGPILDTVGLISPVARSYYPLPPAQIAGNSAIPADLIAAEKPDVVVFLEIFGRRGLLQDPRFMADYRLWRTYPSRVFGSRGLLVYIRRTAVW
ncbi:MAG: hypothetical protein O7D35_06195 [Acidobacteria bacterium]|nr:hypothetical protein [Acidobacteriota bacterium]